MHDGFCALVPSCIRQVTQHVKRQCGNIYTVCITLRQMKADVCRISPRSLIEKMLSPETEIPNVTSGALNSLMRINRE